MRPASTVTETARGFVATAQEGRFLLAGDDGRMRLVVLAPGAGVEAQDLPDLVRRGCPVAVALRPTTGRHAALALRLVEL